MKYIYNKQENIPRILDSFEKSMRFKFFFIILVVIIFKLGLVIKNEFRNNDDLKKLLANFIGHLTLVVVVVVVVVEVPIFLLSLSSLLL